MEILLEKEDHGKVTVMEPGHVFESGDRLRFRFTPNFGGTLFVMDRGTSGSYTLLFPKEDTGTDDKIEAGKAYLLYRRQGGMKANVLPDFFIGAHAAVLCCPLLTRDTRRYATQFPNVLLICP